MGGRTETAGTGEVLTQAFSGPILFQYVWWLLRQAQARDIKTLYFMARDGYLLMKIAEQFCDTFDLPVRCRYLYVSRASLRMPAYHLIGTEADELLLQGGYRVSLRSLLKRAELMAAERRAIYVNCGADVEDEDRLLSRHELDQWRERLKGSALFHRLVDERSRAAYPGAIGYLRQEGLLDGEHAAVVDSGWTGSMQRALGQLLRSVGYRGRLIGFYFGMFVPPKDPADGEYVTWYFEHGTSPRHKIPFSNNLFECLLSAPHGMTVGYERRGGQYGPVQLPAPERAALERIEESIRLTLAYTAAAVQKTSFDAFDEAAARRDAGRRIRRYMAHPRREEAAYYGRWLFCDDVTDDDQTPLAGAEQVCLLRNYSIPARVWRHFFGGRAVPELYWPWGTMAFAPGWKRWWYRVNVYIWEWLRYELR